MTNDGMDSGMAIRKNCPKFQEPSIGRLEDVPGQAQEELALQEDVERRTEQVGPNSGTQVPRSPVFFQIRYIGIMVTEAGSIIVASTSPKRTGFSGKRKTRSRRPPANWRAATSVAERRRSATLLPTQ